MQEYTQKMINADVIGFYEEITQADGSIYPKDTICDCYRVKDGYQAEFGLYKVHQICEIYDLKKNFLYYSLFCIGNSRIDAKEIEDNIKFFERVEIK